MNHTVEEDFEHFLSYSGLRNNPQDVVEKMKIAFEAAWSPNHVCQDSPTFQDELSKLINKHSLEKHSHTPDFILSEFMASCLHVFNKAVSDRIHWYRPADDDAEQKVQRIVGESAASDSESTPAPQPLT